MKLKIIKIKGDWADEIKHYQPNFGRSFIKKTIAEKIINILINLEIFFAEVLANQVRRTYTTTKMISVIKKIFIY